MNRVMMLVLPTDWSPRKTSLYLARAETGAMVSGGEIRSGSGSGPAGRGGWRRGEAGSRSLAGWRGMGGSLPEPLALPLLALSLSLSLPHVAPPRD
jgi:hypothetical protein